MAQSEMAAEYAGGTSCPTPAIWTPVAVERFWNDWATNRIARGPYFAEILGREVIRLAELSGVLAGEVLDYGCGPGYLSKYLLEAGHCVTAVDFSEVSISETESLCSGHGCWRGAAVAKTLPTPFLNGQYNVVFCVEVVEHLLEDWLRPTLGELHRVTSRGGHVIVTTPCEEDLTRQMVVCPFCSTQYHRVQHVRSISPHWLQRQLESAGFSVKFCRGIDLAFLRRERRPPPLRRWSVDVLGSWLVQEMRHQVDRWLGLGMGRSWALHAASRGSGQQLCAIAQKI